MGNKSSTRALIRRLGSRPRREDYKAYVDDLLELQKFLDEKFIGGHLRSCVGDDEFDSEYVNALRAKLEQLRNVRRHVRHAPTTLMTLLDALEPQCQRAVDELTRLQVNRCAMTSAAPAQVLPATVSDDDDDNDLRPGVQTSTIPDGE